MAKRTIRKPKRRSSRKHGLSHSALPLRSQLARDRALHVVAAMRKDARLSLARAAKLHGVKQETIKRHFPSALKKKHGKFQVTKSDRYRATLYVPDTDGNSVAVNTRSACRWREPERRIGTLPRDQS
jgi:hypothetical protein